MRDYETRYRYSNKPITFSMASFTRHELPMYEEKNNKQKKSPQYRNKRICKMRVSHGC